MTAELHTIEDLRKAREFAERFRLADDVEAARLLATPEGENWFVEYGPTMDVALMRRAVNLICAVVPAGAIFAALAPVEKYPA